MKRKKLNIIALSIALLSITLVYFGVIPTREKTVPDSRKVVFRACYEGTQNQATFKLFENNSLNRIMKVLLLQVMLYKLQDNFS